MAGITKNTAAYTRLAVASALALMAVSSGAVAQANANDRPVIHVDSGAVAGVRNGDVDAFKGIPFAAPPLGPLRWQAPQPVARWTGVRSAETFASDCLAGPEGNSWIAPRSAQSEDCLYLNVWKPAAAKHRLPVMVWIYGGGFTNGGTSPAIYDGANLARQGVVLVSVNYRVGQLGFFAHPALAAEQAGKPRGNYGFLDQIAAMKWVRANIAAFGGDPKNVTVFGESAGGFSVHMLLTSPLATGLIDKAIIESGGGRRTIMYGQRMSDDGTGKRPSAEKTGAAWARSHGIEGTDAQALAQLRALPAAEVVKGMGFINPLYSGPMIDGSIVPYNMMTAYNAGKFAHVPLLIGTNTGDMNLNRAKTKDDLFAAFGDQGAQARAAYDPTGQADFKAVQAKVGADDMMHETARFTARHFASSGVPTYLYRFGYVASVNTSSPTNDTAALRDTFTYGGVTGAFHTTEIPFVFDTVKARYGNASSSDDHAMARLMSAYWIAFAKAGDPNGAGRPVWAPFSATSDRLFTFDKDGSGMRGDPWKARLDVTEILNNKIAE